MKEKKILSKIRTERQERTIRNKRNNYGKEEKGIGEAKET
jgi:hypothetical protein